MTKLIGAADIGGMTTKLGLFDEKLRLLKSWSIPTDISDGGINILPNLCSSLMSEFGSLATEYRCGPNASETEPDITQAGTETPQSYTVTGHNSKSEVDNKTVSYSIKDSELELVGVGIDVPAAVDEQDIARNCTNIGWGTVNLRAEVSKLLPDVKILCFGNDATVAALGELQLGAARKHTSAYLITLGTGVGGGYAEDGSVVSGAHGAAGEIGHMLINPHETVSCMCGRYGCLEQYASAAGVVRLARNILYLQNIDESNAGDASQCNPYAECMPDTSGIQSRNTTSAKANNHICVFEGTTFHESTDSDRVHIEHLFKLNIPGKHSRLSDLEHFDAKAICDAAKEGDELSLYILDIFGACMGLAMSSVACTIDPECFIIGGGMSKGGDIVLDAVRKGFARYAYPATADTPIIQAELGNTAGLYGCAAMVIREL